MNKEELKAMIKQLAGEAIAQAYSNIEERRAAANVGRSAIEAIAIGSPADEAQLKHTKAGLLFGGIVAALGACKGSVKEAIGYAKDSLKSERVEKALTAGQATSGGFLIPPEYSQEIIDLLVPRTHVRRHITNVQDLSAGVLDITKLTGSVNVSWGGEVDEIRESEQQFGNLEMKAREEKVLVPISNTLLRRGGERVAATVRNDTLRQMGLAEDLVLLRSPGTVHRPKGLRYWANLANVIAAVGGAPTVAGVTADLGRLMLLLEEGNVPMTSPVWSMAPRTKNFLMTLRDGLGNYAFPEIWQGKLFGWPVESTTHMPRNLGTGADESEILLWDADEMALGQGPSLQVAMSEDATFVDASGKTIAAFQRNLTLLRVISEIDLVARHDLAIGVLTTVKWGK